MSGSLKLRAGQVVEVLSEEEILATLDEQGELESLPFMPEMARYCGQRLTVGAVASKLCDTQGLSGMRRMENAVHLRELRCDGSAHGGCQAGCLIYWKVAWLPPPCEELTTSDPSFRATRVRPPGSTAKVRVWTPACSPCVSQTQ